MDLGSQLEAQKPKSKVLEAKFDTLRTKSEAIEANLGSRFWKQSQRL